MTITLKWATGAFDPYTRDQASMFKKLAFAFLGVGTAAQTATAQAEVLRKPDFAAEIQTDTDTSDLEALDLTQEGVTFPSRTIRKITGKSWCLTDNDTYFYEWTECVLGGTTPVLLGQKIVDGWCEEAGVGGEYGDVYFAATITALTTLTVIHASKGLAMADIVNGDADFTAPKSRLCLVKGAHLSGPSVYTASTAGWVVTVDQALLADGVGTDVVQFANTTGTLVTSTDPVLGGIVSLAFQIWPPHNHRLVLDTNNVTVKCTAVAAIGDENLKHLVQIFVGEAQTIGYSPA
jgi:hypothetical protein